MDEFFASSVHFAEYFDLDGETEYVECLPFKKDIGFSVQREYPNDSRFIAPKTKKGVPDTYALLRVGPAPWKKTDERSKLVPLIANIAPFNRYIYKNFDYNYEDEDCPTEESLLASKRTPRPIDLSFDNEFFFNEKKETFSNSKNEEITGIDLLNYMYTQHVATVDTFKGRLFYWKVKSTSKASNFFTYLKSFLRWLLLMLCGRSIEPEKRSRGFLGITYRTEDIKLLKPERLDVFGYKASKNVVVAFCVLMLSGYLLFSNIGYAPKWMKTIGNNNLLSFSLAVVSITLLDTVLPRVLFWLINLSIKFQYKVVKRVEFK